jgi:predicted nucleic acid-binding Zn ribbon protein
MAFTPLGDALQNKLIHNDPLKNQIESAEVVEIVKSVMVELFGEDLAKDANPLFLKNRTITISCASSVIAQEIRLNQADIVQKINDKLGKNEVDRIRYLA